MGYGTLRARGRKLVTVIGALSAIAACAASAGGSTGQRSSGQANCTWGASSVTATYENGHVVVSKPHTTGCTSPP
jgi:hypothetical protein